MRSILILVLIAVVAWALFSRFRKGGD